jgi:hypothetical protein
MNDYIYRGESVILPTGSDPAAQRTIGYDRYVIGVDLGSAIDATGVVIVRDSELPIWEVDKTGRPTGRQVLSPRSRTCVYADRLREFRYGEIAAHLRAMVSKPIFDNRWTLVCDASGVGRSFVDLLDEAQLPCIAVQMTAAQGNPTKAGRFWNCGKQVLLSNVAGALESRRLTILKKLPLLEDLLVELESFETKQTQTGNQVLASVLKGKGSHADMAIALALAYFGTEHMPGRMSVGRLEGWY